MNKKEWQTRRRDTHTCQWCNSNASSFRYRAESQNQTKLIFIGVHVFCFATMYQDYCRWVLWLFSTFIAKYTFRNFVWLCDILALSYNQFSYHSAQICTECNKFCVVKVDPKEKIAKPVFFVIRLWNFSAKIFDFGKIFKSFLLFSLEKCISCRAYRIFGWKPSLVVENSEVM
jgi:hypothetical protein